MKKTLSLLSLVSLLFISSCATYIKVRMQKPSEFNIGTIRKLAVSEFKISGNHYSNDEHSLASIAANTIVNAITGNNNSSSSSTYPSNRLREIILNDLISNGHFKVIEKNNLLPVVDYDNSIEKLNSTDAEGILTGTGTYSVNDSGEWVDDITYKNGVKITNKKYKINRRIETSISYRLINILNGEILASKTNSMSDVDYQFGEDQDRARSYLKDWRSQVNEQMKDLSEKSIKQIAPYYIYEDREIREGKSYTMKQAFESAKAGRLDESKERWENLLKSQDSITNEYKDDIVIAKYNLGIYHEINNNPEKAMQLFNDCYKASKDNFYNNAFYRAQNRKFELERLKNQNVLENKVNGYYKQ